MWSVKATWGHLPSADWDKASRCCPSAGACSVWWSIPGRRWRRWWGGRPHRESSPVSWSSLQLLPSERFLKLALPPETWGQTNGTLFCFTETLHYYSIFLRAICKITSKWICSCRHRCTASWTPGNLQNNGVLQPSSPFFIRFSYPLSPLCSCTNTSTLYCSNEPISLQGSIKFALISYLLQTSEALPWYRL